MRFNKSTSFKINCINRLTKRGLLVFLLCFSFFSLKAQKDVVVRAYGSSGTQTGAFTGSGFTKLNGESIDGHVAPLSLSSMPTAVSGYNGVHIVIFDFQHATLSSSQASAVVAFARAGGIVIAAVEFGYPSSSNNTNYNTLMNALFGTGHGGITKSTIGSSGSNPSKFTHPNYGTLLLNDATGTLTTANSASYSSFSGVPSENRITQGVGVTSGCDGTALDIIYPAFPGSATQQQVGGVDFDGIFILTGEGQNILAAYGSSTGSGSNRGLAYNQAYTKLFHDFLHDPTAMQARRNWSGTSTNVNSSCPAATHCAAGNDLPKF